MFKTKDSHPNHYLRDERLSRGWSQQEVADRMGTTPNTVSRWELGTTTPHPHSRAKLCELFGKSVDELGLFSKKLIPTGELSSQSRLPPAIPISAGSHVLFHRLQFFTGQEVGTLAGHTGAVLSLAISLNEQILASGSEDHTVKVWNLTTGQELHNLIGHTGAVLGLAISADSQILVSGSADKTIKIWNLSTGKLIQTLIGHTNGVESVAISADGQTLVSGSADKTIKVWRAETT